MKTAKIKVNKTAEQPDGVEIEIVQPDTPLEGRLLGFLLVNAVREAKRENRISYMLPDNFTVEHRSEGTFVVMGSPKPPATASPVPGGGYYQPPRPLAIVGIRTVGNRFDLIHADLASMPGAAKPKAAEADKPQPQATAAGSGASGG